jgi:predicted DNA-binding transcriptional regulator
MKDVLTALKEMGRTLSYFGKEAFWLFVRLSLGVSILALFVFIVVNYFWGLLAGVVIGGLIGWFYIEYQNAKTIREYEEMIHPKDSNIL